MRCLVALALVAGCIEPHVVPCGSLSCPDGTVCLAESVRCVTPSQLSACANLTDQASCIVDGADGRCEDGACTPVACGNGVLDPGEVCDDGNKTSGDGCSGTCTSNETCGNGVLDVATGESCDCGVGSNVSASCSEANSDSPSAPCSVDCHARFCGDGEIDGTEQCDGSLLPATASCQDFGYYGGTLSCSSLCQLSPASCSGRCGDGTIDEANGEYCDGSLPPDASCLSLGFDLGVLQCSSVCAPDLKTCERLTWINFHHSNPGDSGTYVVAAWAGYGRVIVRYDDSNVGSFTGDAYMLGAGAPAKAPVGNYTAVAGTATEGWAVGRATVAHWQPATGWTTETPPWDPTMTYISTAWASDALGLMVAAASDATIYWRHTDGTWTSMTGPVSDAYFGHARDVPYLVGGGGYVWNGTGWDPATSFSELDDITNDDTGRLWAAADGVVWRLDAGTWTQISDVQAEWLAPDGDGVYVGYQSFGLHVTNQVAVVHDGETLIFGDSPGGQVFSDGSGLPLVAGSSGGGLYTLRRGDWDTSYTQQVGTNGEGVNRAPGGPLTTANPPSFLAPDGTWQTFSAPSFQCGDVAVTATGKVYGVERYGDRVWDGGTSVTIGNVGQVGSLWVGGDDSTAAVGGDHVFALRDASGWTITTPPLILYALAGDTPTDLYALATGDGDGGPRLWHYDGAWTAMTPVDTSLSTGCHAGLDQTLCYAGTRLTVTADGVYMAGHDVTIFHRATGVIDHLATPVPVDDVAVADDGSLFATGGPSTFDHSPLWRYDGHTWSGVRPPQGVTGLAGLATVGNRVVVFESISGIGDATTVFSLDRVGTW